MSFRRNVRLRILALAEAPNILHVPPDDDSPLDKAIMSIAAEEVIGAQFNAFVLRYYTEPSEPGALRRSRMRRAFEASMFTDSDPNMIRNSNRALSRLVDRVMAIQEHRARILRSWKEEDAN